MPGTYRGLEVGGVFDFEQMVNSACPICGPTAIKHLGTAVCMIFVKRMVKLGSAIYNQLVSNMTLKTT